MKEKQEEAYSYKATTFLAGINEHITAGRFGDVVKLLRTAAWCFEQLEFGINQ